MSPNLTLVVLAAVLAGTGTHLLMSRSVIRALLGFVLLSNAINLVFLIASGPAGEPAFIDDGKNGVMSDPVPQALVLTAIVIGLAMTAFVLALAHRSWQLARSDEVLDDEESARIHTKAEANELDGPTAEEEAATIVGAFAEQETSEEREVRE